ncbi:hypothetical protein HanXRQr2_Chr10g0425411 [Helianthus annuus]|uniref:Uncharacterized protein n=1 Tax=Helianthus annuus TaxID=4232 RepID=A0A9K3HVI8_HELAN|nr:hypothetical protein HanXRQr2_Chr10g0425411 [Helianthus annuus]
MDINVLKSSGGKQSSYAKAISGTLSQPSLEPIVFCPLTMLESREKIVLIKLEYVEKVKQIFQKHLYGFFVGTVCSLAWVRVNLYKIGIWSWWLRRLVEEKEGERDG